MRHTFASFCQSNHILCLYLLYSIARRFAEMKNTICRVIKYDYYYRMKTEYNTEHGQLGTWHICIPILALDVLSHEMLHMGFHSLYMTSS